MARLNSTFQRIRKIQEMLDEKQYLNHSEQLPVWRRVANFCILVAKSFQTNRGPVRAAALAYTTMLALIPVLAVVVSISTGFLQNDKGQVIDRLLDQFITTIAPQLDLMQTDSPDSVGNRKDVVNRIRGYIDTVNSGALGLTAGMVLVFIAVSVLSSVEATFNDIWGVRRGRTWSARIVQYWAAITLGPIFIVTAMALTTTAQIVSEAKDDPSKAKAILTASNEVEKASSTVSKKEEGIAPVTSAPAIQGSKTNSPPHSKSLTARLLRISYRVPFLADFGRFFLPFIVLSTFLMLFYKLMPATRVLWKPALVGGIVGGGLLQLNNLLNVVYFSRVASYSKIYGGLGAVPIFLLGLYFSWLIILLGAQVAYAFQNRVAYAQEKQAESINQRGREFVALRLMIYVAQKFYLGQTPPTRLQMSDILGVPSQLTCQVLGSLVQGKLLIEALGDETGYAPGRPIDKITVDDILASLRVGNGTELATSDDPSRPIIREEFQRIVDAETHAAGAVTLQNLVLRLANLAPRPELVPAAAVA